MKKEIIWAIKTLNQTIDNVTSICETSYSQVYKLSNRNHIFYLKINSPLFANEANMIQFLNNKESLNNLQLIAQNKQYNCFITYDAGKSLEQSLKKQFKEKLIYETIDHFQFLQNKVTQVELKNIGVRLFEIEKMLTITQPLLLNKITPFIQKQISEDIDYLLDKRIENTLEHGDFHLGNILYNSQSNQITFIDFAEVTLTNPLFSLLSFENSLTYRANCEKFIILNVKEQYLNNLVETKRINQKFKYEIYNKSKKLWNLYNIWCLEELLKTQPNPIYKLKTEEKINRNYIELIKNYHLK